MKTEQENIYARMARFFVENRQLSVLLLISSFIFGIVAFIVTPKQYDPEITLPAFRIVTSYPGASADEVERNVTNPIENKLMELSGIDKMSSQSIAGGQSVVTVLFKIGTDLSASKSAVIQKIESDLRGMPPGADMPEVLQIDPDNVPVMTVAVLSTDFPENSLRAFSLDLKERLKTVSGVTDIEVYGGRSRELQVLLDPEKMVARGLGVSEIERAIIGNDMYATVGNLQGANGEIPVIVSGEIGDRERLARISVGGTSESPIFLEDVADVRDGYDLISHETTLAIKNPDSGAVSNPHVVYISLAKAKGTNITTVTRSIATRIEELRTGNFIPDGVTISVTRDEGNTASEEIMKLTEHLFLAVLIVTVTLIFFLGWRAAFVVATAIPLTLALVFIVGYGAGESINRITLFALIFSLGLLVDDAIVVVENIHRHFSHKTEQRTDAIARASGEVGMGVLLSTVTAVAVFLPMGVVTGMMGAYMGPIAFFAPVARLASLVVAYTLSPYIASFFLREEVAKDGEVHAEQHPKYVLQYKSFIHGILNNNIKQNRILIATLITVLIAFSLPVLELVHFRMLPKADKEQFSVAIDLPDESAFLRTTDITRRVKEIILKDKDVRAVEVFAGDPPVADFNGLFRGSDMRTKPSQSTLKVDLISHAERTRTSEVIATDVRKALTQTFLDVPDVRIKVLEDPPGPPVLATLLARVKADDPMVRDTIARDLMVMYRGTSGVVDIDSTLPTGASAVLLSLDTEKLSRSGLSVADVASTLNTVIRGKDVATAHLGGREHSPILLRFASTSRASIADLSRIELKNTSGELVPLSSMMRVTASTSPAVLWHDAREGTTLVSGEVEGRSVVYVVKDLIQELRAYRPTPTSELTSWNLYGFTYTDKQSGDIYRIEWGGEFEMTLDNFRDLGLAMLLSYFLIYLILVAQFRSFRSSALIMTTIILGFAGVLPGFAILDAISGAYFSATSMIGAIALGGIVVGNAILLLDFIEQELARGTSLKLAIVESAKTRVRPIMLTSLTAVMGAVVIVSDPVWSGLAWALIFGLSLSTVLTLVIFPILFYRFGGVKE